MKSSDERKGMRVRAGSVYHVYTHPTMKLRERKGMRAHSKERKWFFDLLNSPEVLQFAASSPEEQLNIVFRFVNTPLPERDEEWLSLGATVIAFYAATAGHGFILYGKGGTRDAKGEIKADNRGTIDLLTKNIGPPPPIKKWREWIPTLQREVYKYLQDLYANLTGQKGGSMLDFPSTSHKAGTRYSPVVEGRVFHVYESQDATSAFLLWLGDLLAEVDVSKIQRCPVCDGLFYKVKRQRYCSPRCGQKANPPKERVQASRGRKARWQQAREKLSLLLEDMAAVAHKRKLQRPRSEREIFEESAHVLGRVQAAFDKAFPRKRGQGYEEGKAFLARASDQIKRLRKKVRGY